MLVNVTMFDTGSDGPDTDQVELTAATPQALFEFHCQGIGAGQPRPELVAAGYLADVVWIVVNSDDRRSPSVLFICGRVA